MKIFLSGRLKDCSVLYSMRSRLYSDQDCIMQIFLEHKSVMLYKARRNNTQLNLIYTI